VGWGMDLNKVGLILLIFVHDLYVHKYYVSVSLTLIRLLFVKC
jgi:hypothetical protein